jgi:SAM-dependent methyltransferase
VNFKLLFPTFRNRHRFVGEQLARYGQNDRFHQGLNLGTGEGDFDAMIAAHCHQLTGCDVNEADLSHARRMNAAIMNITYEYNNALALTYPNETFDLLVSCEVIEHVGQPALMMQEIGRVLKPGGIAIMTFPNRAFPLTYDPINRFWQWIRKPADREWLIAQGAYAFGHDYLIDYAAFQQWASNAKLEIEVSKGLSHYLTGLLEMYWTGIVQRFFKPNARNVDRQPGREDTLKMRPASTKTPFLVFFTDFVLALDRYLFHFSAHSVGKGVVLRKPKH